MSPVNVAPDKFDHGMMAETHIVHYIDSYFSIVSESSITTRFITEKTYKPIYNFHPFIIICSARFLELLRDKNFSLLLTIYCGKELSIGTFL